MLHYFLTTYLSVEHPVPDTFILRQMDNADVLHRPTHPFVAVSVLPI